MKTTLLYLDDSYLKEFDAIILEVSEKGIVLDKTAFYPKGGGLPNDTGKIIINEREFPVTYVYKEEDKVYHVIEGSIDASEGTPVRGIIDWDRRYRIMRLHTAAHMLSGLMYDKTKALVTGGNINEEKGHIDFGLEKLDRELFEGVIKEANELIKVGRPVKIYYMEREKVLSTPGLVKLADRLPPKVNVLRIVEIEGIDVQADGGPHVANIKEIGEIELLKLESKGKRRKRLYYTVKP